MQDKLICITGPTASGKTALSIALAKDRQTEIILSDSMQLYRHMNIGTAKPTLLEQQAVPHHMVDMLESEETFSVARYVERADSCAQDILRRGMIPIVVGGTGLYLDALIECSKFSGNETDLVLREQLNQIVLEQGAQAVHDMLREIDPESAERLHPNNTKRVIRAIEVFRQTGLTIAHLNAQNKRAAPKYNACILGICPASRETLYDRISRRVDQMMEDGLQEETRTLYEQGKLVGTAAQAIGYKELLDYILGNDSIENCVETLKRRTRNYAKRQLTWLRRDSRVHWLLYEDDTSLESLIVEAKNKIACYFG